MNALARSNVTPISTQFAGHQLALIRRTVAADCNEAEFDLFVAVAQRARLDPLRRQIMALVFNKKNPEKRRMAIVTGIDGFRAISDRSGQYQPDDQEPQFTYDPELKSETNPLGLVKAVVKIFKNGKPVPGVAYWDEFVPLTDEWKEDEATGKRKPTGREILDPKGNWARMGRVMLAKCAEAQAHRKAFPEDTSGLYEQAELDRAQIVDIAASEIVDAHMTDIRLGKVSAAGAIMFQMGPTEPLEHIPLGKIADVVMATVKRFKSLRELDWFESANTNPLREYWAREPGDALELKKVLEKARRDLPAEEPEAAEDGLGAA